MDDQILSVIGGFLSLPITGFAKNFVVGLLLENYSCYRMGGSVPTKFGNAIRTYDRQVGWDLEDFLNIFPLPPYPIIRINWVACIWAFKI